MIGMDDDERMEVYSIESEVRFEEEIPITTKPKKLVKDRQCIPNMITIGKCLLAGINYQSNWKKRTFMNIVNS